MRENSNGKLNNFKPLFKTILSKVEDLIDARPQGLYGKIPNQQKNGQQNLELRNLELP
jgi:hypothetical protein